MQASARLSQDQVDHYKANGYVLYKQPVFPQADFERLRAIFEENLAQYGPENLDVIHFRDPRLLEFLLSDAVLDLVEPVVGPNIGLWSSHFICKPPKVGKATPWHEDSAYWNGRITTMDGICTVWLAIDRATPENGSMATVSMADSHSSSRVASQSSTTLALRPATTSISCPRARSTKLVAKVVWRRALARR